ncbi:hypothetical protein TNCV_3902171 [Trichonephila clavipes]|nr:hypothetical protein TNCV_3902171 [Trichonephila clavipes]
MTLTNGINEKRERTEWRNSPRGARVYCAPLTDDTDVHEQMFQSGIHTDAKLPVLSSQASLLLIYGSSEEMKDGVDLSQP